MKFTVIIPVYNKSDTIKSSVASVFAQTCKDYELIVVDDGSTDDLAGALEEYEGLNLIRQENGGVSVARNTGIDNAKGEFICFLDADDLWEEDHLSTLLSLIEKYSDCSCFVTSHKTVYSDGQVILSCDSIPSYDEDFVSDNFLGLLNVTSYSLIHTNSVCVKKETLDRDQIRFVAGERVGEDTDVWYRLALRNSLVLTKKVTTVYRREYSTATQNSFYTDNWIFSRRESDIVNDSELSDDVKMSAVALIDRYRLTGCRNAMVNRNRAYAKKLLSEVKNRSGKRFLLTKIFTFLPYYFCKFLLKH